MAMDTDGPRSPFSAAELAQWRSRLIERARELDEDLAGLDREVRSPERVASTLTHPAEAGTDLQMQTVSGMSALAEQDLRWQVARALRKIDTGRPLPYGLCEDTREPIDRERLELLPWTPYSIAASERIADQNLPYEALLIDED
jgi:RNA polymerase-binding transcription factor DksA